MGKIVAIGGGELRKGETLPIDRMIVRLAEKPEPRLLFLPTASYDAQGYIDLVKSVYEGLGCRVEALCLTQNASSREEICQTLLASDIIYVGGGDTETMMRLWRERGVDKALRKAYRQGVVLSGLSAGSICWFLAGHSDSEFLSGAESPRCKWVQGLGLLPFLHCPHYNESPRREFDAFFAGQAVDAIALDNNAALVEIDGRYSIVRAEKDSGAYRLHWNGAAVEKTGLTVSEANTFSAAEAVLYP